VLGVSVDPVASHQKFIEKYQLPFDLLADPDKQIVEAYGVWKEKNMYGKKYWGTARTTFLINEEGTIDKIFKKVKSAEHAAQILA
jgi:peroxiredoxin Q/BCP